MRCRLCLQDKDLCQSHILPEFLYKPLYDEKGRFQVLTPAGPEKRLYQKGIREPLLCKDCEVRLSRYERYARSILFGPKAIMPTRDGEKATEYPVDYTKFKLFELSVLWRVGVSNVREFHGAVLGKHEAKIRHMLIDGNPGNATEYGCIVNRPVKDQRITGGLITFVGKEKVKKVDTIRLFFARCSWTYFLTRSSLGPTFDAVVLQQQGFLLILKGDFGIDKYIEDFVQQISRNRQKSRPKVR